MVVDPATKSSFEAALEAWALCCPDSFMQSEQAVRSRFSDLAARIPGARASQGSIRRSNRLFLPGEGDAPRFLRMLSPVRGQVHFLYFWRAYCKAAAFIRGAASGLWEGGLAGDFDALRDEVLRGITDAHDRPNSELSVGTRQVADVLACLAKASVLPEFWEHVSGGITDIGLHGKLGIEELTVLIAMWHRDARGFQRVRRVPHTGRMVARSAAVEVTGVEDASGEAWGFRATPPRPELLQLEHVEQIFTNLVVSGSPRRSPQTPRTGLATAAGCLCMPGNASPRRRSPLRESGHSGLPVFVHIYDVSLEEGVQKLNRFLAHRLSPVKFGGIFHAGVEVGGMEWSFGFSLHENVPGVSCHEPRRHPDHHYRQSIPMKRTVLNQQEVADLIARLIEEYPGSGYDLLRRNCCHFAEDFICRLDVGTLPAWVHRLARVGVAVDSALQVANALNSTVRRALMHDKGSEDSGGRHLEDKANACLEFEDLPSPSRVQPL